MKKIILAGIIGAGLFLASTAWAAPKCDQGKRWDVELNQCIDENRAAASNISGIDDTKGAATNAGGAANTTAVGGMGAVGKAPSSGY